MIGDLKPFTDGELSAELERRRKALADAEAAARKAAEVRVYCPLCDGRGSVPQYGLKVATGELPDTATCSLCEGQRIVTARRA